MKEIFYDDGVLNIARAAAFYLPIFVSLLYGAWLSGSEREDAINTAISLIVFFVLGLIASAFMLLIVTYITLRAVIWGGAVILLLALARYLGEKYG